MTKITLVLVSLLHGLADPRVAVFETYDSIEKCFQAWEAVAYQLSDDGYYPAGTQAVCIALPAEAPNE